MWRHRHLFEWSRGFHASRLSGARSYHGFHTDWLQTLLNEGPDRYRPARALTAGSVELTSNAMSSRSMKGFWISHSCGEVHNHGFATTTVTSLDALLIKRNDSVDKDLKHTTSYVQPCNLTCMRILIYSDSNFASLRSGGGSLIVLAGRNGTTYAVDCGIRVPQVLGRTGNDSLLLSLPLSPLAVQCGSSTRLSRPRDSVCPCCRNPETR